MKTFFLNHQNNTFKNLNKMDVDIFLSINNIVTDMVANDSFTHTQNIRKPKPKWVLPNFQGARRIPILHTILRIQKKGAKASQFL